MVHAGLPSKGSGHESASFDHGGVGGYILAGLIIFGGLGLWMDRWLGLSFLTPLGLVLGAVLGSYLLYLRVFRATGEPTVHTQGGSGPGLRHEGESE
jgi:hypothetical protein